MWIQLVLWTEGHFVRVRVPAPGDSSSLCAVIAGQNRTALWKTEPEMSGSDPQ